MTKKWENNHTRDDDPGIVCAVCGRPLPANQGVLTMHYRRHSQRHRNGKTWGRLPP